MAENNRKKTLSYRRTVYFGETDKKPSLEKSLIRAHERKTTIEQRRAEIPNEGIIECRNFKQADRGVLIHLAAYTPGEKASTVKRLEGVDSGDVDTTNAPRGSEFMDGDMMIYVVGNHVVLCTSGLHEKNASRYMISIIVAAKLKEYKAQFHLLKVGDVNKLKMIEAQGVKSVHLGASLYDATIDYEERKSISSRLRGGIMDQVKALIEKDIPDVEIDKLENLSASIVLSYDARSKKKVLGKETLESLSQKILAGDGEDGFTIETVGGEKITHDEVTVRKSVNLTKHGKSVFRDEAWRELQQYFAELEKVGILEQ